MSIERSKINTINSFLGNDQTIFFIRSSCYYSDQSKLYTNKKITDPNVFTPTNQLISYDNLPDIGTDGIDGKIIVIDPIGTMSEENIQHVLNGYNDQGTTIFGINTFYLIVDNSAGVDLYEKYKSSLSNPILSTVIQYRVPTGTVSEIQQLIRNTLLYIKTYISSHLTHFKTELLAIENNVDPFFKNHNTTFDISPTKTTSSLLLDHYINGDECGKESLIRVYLPFDISKEEYENAFVKKRINGEILSRNPTLYAKVANSVITLKKTTQLRMLQALYDCYYVEYLYNNQYYSIKNNEMIFNIINDDTNTDMFINPNAIFQLQGTILENNDIIDDLNDNLNENQSALTNLMKRYYNELNNQNTAAKVAALNQYINKRNDFNGLKYSCAKIYANLKIIKYIQELDKKGNFIAMSWDELRTKIPNEKNLGWKIKLTIPLEENDKREIQKILTNDALIHLMNEVNPTNPGAAATTNLVPNKYYYDLFEKNEYVILFQLIQENRYQCIMILKKYGENDVDVPFPISIPLKYKGNLVDLKKLPIKIYYPPSTFSRFAKNAFTFTMDFYFAQANSVTLCNKIPYTKLGLMQHANENIDYLTKLMLLNNQNEEYKEKYTLENFVLFRCFQNANLINTLWESLELNYNHNNTTENFDLYPYINYIIQAENENYIKEPRIYLKRRIISLFLYILRKMYRIVNSSAFVRKNSQWKKSIEHFNFLSTTTATYNTIKDSNNFTWFDVSNRVILQNDKIHTPILGMLRSRNNLNTTDWNNILNGHLLYIISQYNQFLKQDDKLDFNEGERLTEDILRQRVIRWTTGLVYLPDIPPTNEQIRLLLLENIIDKSVSKTIKVTTGDMVSIWIKCTLFNRDIYMRLYYENAAIVLGTADITLNGRTKTLDGWIKEYSNVNVENAINRDGGSFYSLDSIYVDHPGNDARLVQWTSPEYNYNDEILNLFYSSMSCFINVGLDCYFRCYFYIKSPLPIPDNIIGWCWNLPFFIEADKMEKIYNELIKEAKEVAIDILNMRCWNHYTNEVNQNNQQNLDFNTITTTLSGIVDAFMLGINRILRGGRIKEKIYAIASYLQNILTRNGWIDEDKDRFIEIDVNDNYANRYKINLNVNDCDVNLEFAPTTNAIPSSMQEKRIYENNIKNRFIQVQTENQQRNKELIERIICIAREKLKDEKILTNTNIGHLHFDSKQAVNMLPYYGIIENANTYIVDGVSDKEEMEFIEDYMFNQNVKQEDSLIVNDSKVCIELSKIVNDTDLTSEISAFPKNAMDDNIKLDRIRQMIK